jgi:effector-binding domain-containing protein
LSARLAEIEGGGEESPQAAVAAIPALRVASLCGRVARLEGGVEELFDVLEREVASDCVRGDGPPFVIYHDRDHREADARVEVALPVAADARRAGRARVWTMPAVPMAACLVYAGDYQRWGDLSRALVGWLSRRRLRPAGPMREVFLQFRANEDGYRIPHAYRVERPADQLTEMQIPVRSTRPGRDARDRSGVTSSRGSPPRRSARRSGTRAR